MFTLNKAEQQSTDALVTDHFQIWIKYQKCNIEYQKLIQRFPMLAVPWISILSTGPFVWGGPHWARGLGTGGLFRRGKIWTGRGTLSPGISDAGNLWRTWLYQALPGCTWNLVAILKFGCNSEFWSQFWNLVAILKFGCNSESWSTFWNLVKILKFG